MQTLIPATVAAASAPERRRHRLPGYALTARSLYLLLAGLLFAIPAFFSHRTLWMMPAWDGAVLLLALLDAVRLPRPEEISAARSFEHPLYLGESNTITVTVTQRTRGRVRIGVLDGLHPSLSRAPEMRRVTAFPNEPVAVRSVVYPSRRGDLELDKVFLRYSSPAGLSERWASVPLQQRVRVLPSSIASGDDAMYLLQARQMEIQKRRQRRIGLGREFEALRDYQPGDELRNVSWTATARRGKPITRTFTTERSQQVWTVLDAGRLSRTSFELKLRAAGRRPNSGTFHDQVQDSRIYLQQLDQAASAAMLLSQVADRAGDRSALLGYGRTIQQQVTPGRGARHLRRISDALAGVRAEQAEADHRSAAARLRQLQGRRSLIFWITEMAESASLPDVSIAVADLARRHLVVLVLLEHPELDSFAQRQPTSAADMFAITAANEMLARRRSVIAQLERRGVLVLETSPARVGAAAIRRYLDIKARGTL